MKISTALFSQFLWTDNSKVQNDEAFIIILLDFLNGQLLQVFSIKPGVDAAVERRSHPKWLEIV